MATVTATRTVKQILSDAYREWEGGAPASEAEIRALEDVLGVPLPSEYVELLRYSCRKLSVAFDLVRCNGRFTTPELPDFSSVDSIGRP